MTSLATTARSRIAFFLVAAGTVLELAGTDLVLPAVPALPHELGGDLSSAQWVIAAFVAGVSLGLLIFGAVGPRFGRRRTMVAALLAYSSLSFASAFSTSMSVLIGFRFLQGVAASAPAVFAPAIIRALFDDAGATRALGLLGSIESLVPAFAPVVGAWLLWIVGWRGGFVLTAVLAALLALGVGVAGGPFRQAKDRYRPVPISGSRGVRSFCATPLATPLFSGGCWCLCSARQP
jgi:MFS transporter, DHA1 family, multidrug resistance protein